MSRSSYFAHKEEGQRETLQGFLMRELNVKDAPKMSLPEIMSGAFPASGPPRSEELESLTTKLDDLTQRRRDEDFLLEGLPANLTAVEIVAKIKEFFEGRIGYTFDQKLTSRPHIGRSLVFRIDENTVLKVLYTYVQGSGDLFVTVSTEKNYNPLYDPGS